MLNARGGGRGGLRNKKDEETRRAFFVNSLIIKERKAGVFAEFFDN